MPKASKLHSKGKTTTIQKSTQNENEGQNDPEDNLRQFQLELCWCIQQLEKLFTDKKENERKLQEAWKVLAVLKNNNQPMIRKRQLMRNHFGNYRAKMAAEEKKLATMASKIKISETPAQPKATFLRKSVFLTTGDDSFKFNFNITPEKDSESEIIEDIPKIEEKKKHEDSSNCDFKFSFTSSDFKFNFNNENT